MTYLGGVGEGGQGVVASRDVLLERGLAFKTYFDKGKGCGGLKSEDFSGDVIYG